MNERLVTINLCLMDPTEGNVSPSVYFYAPHDMTIIQVSVAPTKDDADATLDINDDGSDVIAAIACVDADVAGSLPIRVGGAVGGIAVQSKVPAGKILIPIVDQQRVRVRDDILVPVGSLLEQGDQTTAVRIEVRRLRTPGHEIQHDVDLAEGRPDRRDGRDRGQQAECES